jgi:segregation and condensation protein A
MREVPEPAGVSEAQGDVRPPEPDPDGGPFGRGAATPYTVKVPGFEGPLDLLLTLVHRGDVDLSAIPLADLARDLLERTKRQLDLPEATEALWMLAALVEMKAKLLLPKPPPAEPLPEPETADLPAQLEAQMAEYRAFREAAEALRALEEVQQRIFLRPPQDPGPADLPLVGLSLDELFRVFAAVLERARRNQAAEVVTEPIRVVDRMAAILQAVRRAPEGITFDELFPEQVTTVMIVVTFLALLELIRERKVRAEQDGPLAPIRVRAATA